jgi:general secretion pathway protein N
MQLSWGPLELVRNGPQVDLIGSTTLDLRDVASRMSPVRPLGSYTVQMDWQGSKATLQLKTRRGPLLLSGNGSLTNGRLKFSGMAEAEAGHADQLSNLLNLLGRHRRDGDRDVIALEFK